MLAWMVPDVTNGASEIEFTIFTLDKPLEREALIVLLLCNISNHTFAVFVEIRVSAGFNEILVFDIVPRVVGIDVDSLIEFWKDNALFALLLG